jgi:hypothetical protein
MEREQEEHAEEHAKGREHRQAAVAEHPITEEPQMEHRIRPAQLDRDQEGKEHDSGNATDE